MNPRTLWQLARRIRWRSSIATLFSNIKLYGWSATLQKVILRYSMVFQGQYRKSTLGRGREPFATVSPAAALFGRPTILIVGALDLPQCKKYRVTQKVEFFRSIGWDCQYSHYADATRVVSYLQISTALIFYRVPSCAQFDDYLEEARRLGIKTFYDIDDPIFNTGVYSENKNLEHIAPQERAHLLASATDYRNAMTQVDALILSTTYLEQLARTDLGMVTYLWRNLADPATLSIVENIKREHKDVGLNKVIVGYASGSRAHDEDFKVVAEALVNILEMYANVELQIIGYAVVPPSLERFKDKINTRPFSGYAKYFEALSQVDINIVPLVDDRFNASKSAIRYLEASLCSVPTIASSVGQFSEIITNGRDGNLATTQDAWVLALRDLIESPELRLNMGQAANDTVRRHYTFSCPDVVDHKLLEQFALSNE